MNTADLGMMPLQKSKAVPISCRKVAHIKVSFEIRRYSQTPDKTFFIAIRVRIRQVVMIVQTSEHAVFPWKWSKPLRCLQAPRTYDASGAEQLSCFEDGIDFGVGETLVDVDPIGENRDPGRIKFPLHLAIVFRAC